MTQFARRWRHELYRGCRPEVPALLAMAYAARLRAAEREGAARRIAELNAAVRRALENLPLHGGGKIRCTVPRSWRRPICFTCSCRGSRAACWCGCSPRRA
ncbi:MAG: hypothetical protein L6W00_11245 [Lentisphaeria bacterium]|nr:MAG: hypothetical protein L6W00_11245 [Lentisphaeria bacterium]